MRLRRLEVLMGIAWALAALSAMSSPAQAQTTVPVNGDCKVTPAPASVKRESAALSGLGGIKITVTGSDGKPLARKRFYLLEKNVQQVSGVNFSSVPSRDEFYKGASAPLRDWLKKHDCDTIYCPELESEYKDAINTVPEFKQAFAEGLKKYKSPNLALKWITVNFPLKAARTRYYERKRDWTEDAAKKAGKVLGVMTDEKGVAFFTDVKPNVEGAGPQSYFISNVIPTEKENVLWDCEVVVPTLPPGKLQSVTVEFNAPKAKAATAEPVKPAATAEPAKP